MNRTQLRRLTRVETQPHPEPLALPAAPPGNEVGILAAHAATAFGADHVRHDRYVQKSDPTVFPVLRKDGRIVSSVDVSEPLQRVPVVAVEYVFVSREQLQAARKWLDQNRSATIQPKGEDLA